LNTWITYKREIYSEPNSIIWEIFLLAEWLVVSHEGLYCMNSVSSWFSLQNYDFNNTFNPRKSADLTQRSRKSVNRNSLLYHIAFSATNCGWGKTPWRQVGVCTWTSSKTGHRGPRPATEHNSGVIMKDFGAWHLEACSECRPQRRIYWWCPAQAVITGQYSVAEKHRLVQLCCQTSALPFSLSHLQCDMNHFGSSPCFKTAVLGWKLSQVHDNCDIIEASYIKFHKNSWDNPKYRRNSIRPFGNWSWKRIKANELHAWEYPYRRRVKELEKYPGTLQFIYDPK
jgi:hypothetical protein